MKQMEAEQRFNRREKRRKTNRMLNILIVVVFVLIAMFAYRLIANQAKNSTSNTENKTEQPSSEATTDDTDKEKKEDNVIKDENSVEETTDPVDERVIVPTEDNKVLEAFINPSWEPVGTTQSEPHETQFDSSSQDWKEMLKAVSYATELTEEDYIVWFIGNNGPSRAIATIQTKDRQYKYRVSIEWVETKGWKPTLVEQLKS